MLVPTCQSHSIGVRHACRLVRWAFTARVGRLFLLPHRSFASTSTGGRRRNFYEVLGVTNSATANEIKQAFYTLSKKVWSGFRGSYVGLENMEDFNNFQKL